MTTPVPLLKKGRLLTNFQTAGAHVAVHRPGNQPRRSASGGSASLGHGPVRRLLYLENGELERGDDIGSESSIVNIELMGKGG